MEEIGKEEGGGRERKGKMQMKIMSEDVAEKERKRRGKMMEKKGK